MEHPFKEEVVDNSYIRTFDESISEESLKWHWDNEDRLIESIGHTDWKFQFDNELPIDIDGKIFIKRGCWHRVIKGSGSLKIKVIKYV